jgi:transcriptional regulator of aromatic amino acid metabolism
MKRTDEPHSKTLPSAVPSKHQGRAGGTTSAGLFLVHPMPQSGPDILSVAVHLVQRFAAAQGKDVPGLSQDAAQFLLRRRWPVGELALRLAQAVATNRGSLITAADLVEP